jgi:(p)ppGpp synthase/HD superfamily hydrolase
MNQLERAISIAAEAHDGQLGKGDEPLVLHPLRMMLRCTALDEQLTAILHDVVEKSSWTLDALRAEGFPAAVIDAVDALSRREGEGYFVYIRRAKTLPLGRMIKVLDLEDHIQRTRSIAQSSEDLARLDRYIQALEIIRSG